MFTHDKFLWVTFNIMVFPPQELQVFLLIFWDFDSTSSMTATFSSQNLIRILTIWYVRSRPGSNSLFIDFPSNSALQSNTIHILPGLLGWYQWCIQSFFWQTGYILEFSLPLFKFLNLVPPDALKMHSLAVPVLRFLCETFSKLP